MSNDNAMSQTVCPDCRSSTAGRCSAHSSFSISTGPVDDPARRSLPGGTLEKIIAELRDVNENTEHPYRRIHELVDELETMAGVVGDKVFSSSGGGSSVTLTHNAYAVEIDRLRAEIARVTEEAADWRLSFETANDAIGKAEADVEQWRTALTALRDTWRAEGVRIDTFHATMGTGWHVCADEVAALLAGSRET